MSSLVMNRVADHDQHRRGHHGLRGCAAHTLRAAFGREPVIAADTGDDEAEDDRLGQSHEHIAELQRLICSGPVLIGVEAQHEDRRS